MGHTRPWRSRFPVGCPARKVGGATEKPQKDSLAEKKNRIVGHDGVHESAQPAREPGAYDHRPRGKSGTHRRAPPRSSIRPKTRDAVQDEGRLEEKAKGKNVQSGRHAAGPLRGSRRGQKVLPLGWTPEKTFALKNSLDKNYFIP